jgi:dihydroflavonol-4-reductase
VKVLVTGASGFIGSWVVRELAARGHAVRALVRPTSRLSNLEDLAVERAEGDVLDRASVVRALEGCDAVVHTAGVVEYGPDVADRVHAVNSIGPEVVLRAALEARVSRAVLTSSIAAVGGSTSPRVADERTPSTAERSGIDYFAAKRRGELAALKLHDRGLPVVVVRPGFALGPGDIYRSSASTVLRIVKGQLPVYVRGGLSVCDVRDVARGHVEALLRGRAGSTYLLAGHNLEMREFTSRVAQIAGVRRPREVPYPVALAAATLDEAVSRLRGRRPQLPRQLVSAARYYTFATSARAQAELGYAVRPFDESLRDTLRWFIEQGRLEARTPELRALAGVKEALQPPEPAA